MVTDIALLLPGARCAAYLHIQNHFLVSFVMLFAFAGPIFRPVVDAVGRVNVNKTLFRFYLPTVVLFEYKPEKSLFEFTFMLGTSTACRGI